MEAFKSNSADQLFQHVKGNNIHAAIALLDEKAVDKNSKNINGKTALHFAVESRNRTMIETLLMYGADPNLPDNIEVGGNTPMHLASEANMVDVMEIFLQP